MMRRFFFSKISIFLVLALLCSKISAFAARKKGGGKKPVAGSNRGFGIAPPTLDEVVSGFRTRLPETDDHDCPCGSSKAYGDCCKLLHIGSRECTAPVDVLRSRYSAFRYRLVKHIIETTHPTCRDYQEDKIAWAKDLHKQGMFDSYNFVALEHGPESIEGDEGFIEFTVKMAGREDIATPTLAGKETKVSERSKFLRDSQGTWAYASGEVRMEDATQDAILN
eukprot:CAMPEP_0198146454 /NCGR_PEP_ID=MMETSP1443-20131203/29589_1 /TAXON_ID=186043 /ORGANISM="Entomoneis sp., Strain CCMP2396" /LENGTH=222 /DNA_ID=CAMNT_0043810433 /DNA_START=86 /DNA_END=754 /DNA_ORIENTATION=-